MRLPSIVHSSATSRFSSWMGKTNIKWNIGGGENKTSRSYAFSYYQMEVRIKHNFTARCFEPTWPRNALLWICSFWDKSSFSSHVEYSIRWQLSLDTHYLLKCLKIRNPRQVVASAWGLFLWWFWEKHLAMFSNGWKNSYKIWSEPSLDPGDPPADIAFVFVPYVEQ